jgi:hypothetical protein
MPASAQQHEDKAIGQLPAVHDKHNVTEATSKVANLKTVKVKQKTDTAKPEETRPPKKRLTKAEQIKRQANPKSLLAGKQKTIVLLFDYRSDILHQYLELNQSTMLSAYERLAGLMRLCANDAPTYKHVTDWVTTNLTICKAQLEALESQRATMLDEYLEDLEPLDIHVPENYQVTFETSHPVTRKMLALLRLVDNELNATEDLFMQGIIDDAAYVQSRNQVSSIVRASVDRIYKATSPGVRKGGRYQPSQLASWIRKGNTMMFSDVPKEYQHLIEEEK